MTWLYLISFVPSEIPLHFCYIAPFILICACSDGLDLFLVLARNLCSTLFSCHVCFPGEELELCHIPLA